MVTEMAIHKLQLAIFTLYTIVSLYCTCNAQYNPPDNYLIDCGSRTNTTIGQRIFLSDTSLSTSLTTPQDILASTSSNSIPSTINAPLLSTARIFTGPSSYTFQVQKQGRHFIRLHFFPFSYQSYDLATAKFTVSTQDVVLLTDFTPNGKSSTLFKEYSLNLTSDTLVLSFMPSQNLAFVNAIEVTSVPDNLISDTAQIVNPFSHYSGLSKQTLETMYRVNMGGPLVTPDNDTLWRTWVSDQNYLNNSKLAKPVVFSGKINYMSGGATQETAPDSVYNTAAELAVSNTTTAVFNMSWQFKVNGGSSYLIRLHFCDIVSQTLNELYFNVYIDSWWVVHDMDLSTLSQNSLATAYYTDYVLSSSDSTDTIQVSIGPSTLENVLPDGILNGLEIMQIVNGSGSAFMVRSSGGKANLGVILGSIIGSVAILIFLVIVALMCMKKKKKMERQSSKNWMPFSINGFTSLSTGSRTSNGTTLTLGPNGSYGYRFAFSLLQESTNNFDENWVIGVGGFGKVYKGILRDETKVAVKRGNPKSQQGLNEFRTEIELLSRLRHRHLVSLIGYCDERNEMILVYEYMEKGTVKSHLYGTDLPAPSWKQRLDICIGAARGLHYLHTGSAKAIIHRDVKSANILLDENLLAKVSDFGLSKTGPELDQTHVSTAVKGSFGYLDPEYFRRQQLTEKSDVYSFGVVLLEVLCARPVIDPTLPREMVNLAEWGMKWQKRGELQQIVDQRIAGTIKPESLKKFGITVEKCLADYGVERPSMGDVLWNLEYVQQLQETDSGANSEVNSINRIVELSSHVHHVGSQESVDLGEAGTSYAHNEPDLSDVSMSRVFSQLIKAEGR
ncbi:receptor-like protein kinase HERK 1 [Carex littledalei]|uniref:Receptor-like protein kinase HERK 1 n=1 Tax=Carex littledalei TaxID=544730 RepID=A0A833VN82_9POAL|nr:receptor-like protein kinase HERK 1 [Carex littledalei]